MWSPTGTYRPSQYEMERTLEPLPLGVRLRLPGVIVPGAGPVVDVCLMRCLAKACVYRPSGLQNSRKFANRSKFRFTSCEGLSIFQPVRSHPQDSCRRNSWLSFGGCRGKEAWDAITVDCSRANFPVFRPPSRNESETRTGLIRPCDAGSLFHLAYGITNRIRATTGLAGEADGASRSRGRTLHPGL